MAGEVPESQPNVGDPRVSESRGYTELGATVTPIQRVPGDLNGPSRICYNLKLQTDDHESDEERGIARSKHER